MSTVTAVSYEVSSLHASMERIIRILRAYGDVAFNCNFICGDTYENTINAKNFMTEALDKVEDCLAQLSAIEERENGNAKD